MLGVELPVYNTFQQKIAFEDHKGVIPRSLPFSIDLDGQRIDWTDEERELLLTDPDFDWLAGDMPGAIHCRPDGGDHGKWVKLGWAYNESPAKVSWEPQLDESFPEIVLRGAARLNPALKAYYGQLPRNMHHYGGWYTMTEENWPLIGRYGARRCVYELCHVGLWDNGSLCRRRIMCSNHCWGGIARLRKRVFSRSVPSSTRPRIDI